MISSALCQKVYNDLGKHGFSRQLLLSLHHTSFPQSRSWRQWHWQPGKTKRKNRLHWREERGRGQCIILSLIHNAGFISALKTIPIAMRSSKHHQPPYPGKVQRHVACWLKRAFLGLRLSPPSVPAVQNSGHNSSYFFLCHANDISSWMWNSLKYMKKASSFQ